MSEANQANSKITGGVIFFLAGFVIMLALGWFVFPMLLYSQKAQPVSFSHRLHIENAGLDCQNCHGFREDGTFKGVPNMMSDSDGACLNCHDDPASPQGEDPREKAFLEDLVAQGVEKIDWLVYSRQPPCVFFPHAAHMLKAEIECRHCHGAKEDEDAPPVYEKNRITGYSRDIWGRNISGLTSNPWDSMKMSDCGDCHDERGASNACFVCHK